jgi:hypothetical protein
MGMKAGIERTFGSVFQEATMTDGDNRSAQVLTFFPLHLGPQSKIVPRYGSETENIIIS